MIEVAVAVVVVAMMVVVDIAQAIILQLGQECATFRVPKLVLTSLGHTKSRNYICSTRPDECMVREFGCLQPCKVAVAIVVVEVVVVVVAVVEVIVNGGSRSGRVPDTTTTCKASLNF